MAVSASTWPHGTPQPLGLAQQHPLAWLCEGIHQAHGPTVRTSHYPTHGGYGTAGCLSPAGMSQCPLPQIAVQRDARTLAQGPFIPPQPWCQAPSEALQGPQDHPTSSLKADALCELSSGEGTGHPLQVQWLEGDKDEVDARPEVHCALWIHEVMGCSHANIQLKASDLRSVHPRGQWEGMSQNEGARCASPRLLVPPGRDTRSLWPAAKRGYGQHRASVCPRWGGSRDQSQQPSHPHPPPPPAIAGLVLADFTGGAGACQGPREMGRGGGEPSPFGSPTSVPSHGHQSATRGQIPSAALSSPPLHNSCSKMGPTWSGTGGQ